MNLLLNFILPSGIGMDVERGEVNQNVLFCFLGRHIDVYEVLSIFYFDELFIFLKANVFKHTVRFNESLMYEFSNRKPIEKERGVCDFFNFSLKISWIYC